MTDAWVAVSNSTEDRVPCVPNRGRPSQRAPPTRAWVLALAPSKGNGVGFHQGTSPLESNGAAAEYCKKSLLSQLDPRWFAVRALSPFGWATDNGDGFVPADFANTFEALAGRPKRRSVDASRLEQVAESFRRDGASGVQTDCHVSKSQAYRLIAQAREHGHLPAAGEQS